MSMKNIFLIATIFAFSGFARANRIELRVQSKHHGMLEELFSSEIYARTLPITLLEIREGEEAEFAGTCFSYTGLRSETSIKIQLLKQSRCISPGVLFEEEGDDGYCTPASIAITVDGVKSKDGASIKVTMHNSHRIILHEKHPVSGHAEPVYCYYPF